MFRIPVLLKWMELVSLTDSDLPDQREAVNAPFSPFMRGTGADGYPCVSGLWSCAFMRVGVCRPA
ncbi:hypothetical protein [Gimesia fumaroli]|uniref:hypothetical protein n=1 Tax=Gimesia fumaroli TaxID=2527976 RepID=UPI0011AA1D1B|nr:hypothetical protein [Gimesia fumaroli]